MSAELIKDRGGEGAQYLGITLDGEIHFPSDVCWCKPYRDERGYRRHILMCAIRTINGPGVTQ